MQSTWEFGGMHPPAADDLVTVHERVQAGPEFTELRRRLRRWVFAMSAAFMLWYVAFVLLASYARGVMATPVSGPASTHLVRWPRSLALVSGSGDAFNLSW